MNKLSVLIGPMLALGLIVSGAASASVLPQASVKSVDAAPLYLAAPGRCTLAAPDLSALAIWSRYPNPAHAGSVMIPEVIRVALDVDHAGCQGLVRDKSYVVELPHGRS
jgi:hypothetical protein